MPRLTSTWNALPKLVLETVLQYLQVSNWPITHSAQLARDIKTAVNLQRVCKGWRSAYGFENAHLWRNILHARHKALQRARAQTLNRKAMQVYARHALEQESMQAAKMKALLLWVDRTVVVDEATPRFTRDSPLQHSIMEPTHSIFYDMTWGQHCDRLRYQPRSCLQEWRPLFVQSTTMHVHLYCVPTHHWFTRPTRFAFQCKELEDWCGALFEEAEISALASASQTPREIREWLSIWTAQAREDMPVLVERETSLYRISWCKGASWVPRVLPLDTYGLQRALQPLSRPRVDPQKSFFELTFLFYRHYGFEPGYGLYMLGHFYHRIRGHTNAPDLTEAMRELVFRWIRENHTDAKPQPIDVRAFRAVLLRSHYDFEAPHSIAEEEAIMNRGETQVVHG